MSEPLMSESYQRGWNDACLDMEKTPRVITTIFPHHKGPDYAEGYMAGQDNCLFEMSKERGATCQTSPFANSRPSANGGEHKKEQ